MNMFMLEFLIKNNTKMEKLLMEFIEWAKYAGDAFYIFDNEKEAIQRFILEKEIDNNYIVKKI